MSTQSDEDMELLKRAAESLGEHFDTVQIFATRHEPEVEDGTISASWGVGNWFTRYGQTQEWIIKANERTRKGVREETE